MSDPRRSATAAAADPGGDGPRGVPIALRDLSVAVAGKPLLERVSVELPAGEISLIVGPSGAGKSVFLNLLAGLIGPGTRPFEIAGELEIGGRSRFRGGRSVPVGIVFQSFALFDELTAAGNVEFGRDHRQGSRDAVEPEALLDEFGVPKDVPVSLLSGGQKQRLAVARTLAYDPDIVVYDEPTSGLDPANAHKVADRIRSTQDAHGKTTVVVTHDYAHLAPIAAAIFFLDDDARDLVPVPAEELETLAERFVRADPEAGPTTRTTPAPPGPTRPRLRDWAGRSGGTIGSFFEGTSRAAEAFLVSLLRIVPAWRSLRWGLRYLRHYLALLASPSSFAYFGAAGLIAGLVSTHFTFKFLPFKAYTEPLITEELLQGLGFSLYRIITPVLLTVLLAARGGAAIAADVGSRAYSRQIDALRSFRARPESYLLTNILYALLITTPILVLFGFWVARLTSFAVFMYNYPQHGPLFWDGQFHRVLRSPATLLYAGTGWVLLKVLACGFGVGAIGYFQGLRPKNSAVDVSRGITRTIIWATLYVLFVHFVFAFLEF